MNPAELDTYLFVMRKHSARALTVNADGFEVVLDPIVQEKEREPDAVDDNREMPTRAELDAEIERIRKGGLTK